MCFPFLTAHFSQPVHHLFFFFIVCRPAGISLCSKFKKDRKDFLATLSLALLPLCPGGSPLSVCKPLLFHCNQAIFPF